jgi:hypothetical protein
LFRALKAARAAQGDAKDEKAELVRAGLALMVNLKTVKDELEALKCDAKQPDMLWDAEDTEGTFASSADEFAANYASDSMIRGDVSMVEIQCAVQIENRTMRIEVTTDEESPVKWEWVDAAITTKAAS